MTVTAGVSGQTIHNRRRRHRDTVRMQGTDASVPGAVVQPAVR